jgi:uncharacterized protein
MSHLYETALTGMVQGTLVIPEPRSDLGVVVAAGSSGRVDVGRAKLFASHGAVALALRWFGGDGQVPGICEVPLETFTEAADELVAQGCKRLAFVGTSKGAEAGLLTALYDSRFDVVAAISPTSVVWGNVGPGRDGEVWPQRSSWTYQGTPLPFIASDPYWKREYVDGLVSYRSLHEQSLVRFASEVDAATIRVEAIQAQIVLVAGCSDALWPSDIFAKSIASRLTTFGKHYRLLLNQEAGHRVLLPGEMTPRSGLHAHGGHDKADAALGQDAWNAVTELLGLVENS